MFSRGLSVSPETAPAAGGLLLADKTSGTVTVPPMIIVAPIEVMAYLSPHMAACLLILPGPFCLT